MRMRELQNETEIKKKAYPSSGESKARFVREMFTRIAPRYDLVNTLATFNRDRSWRRKAVSLAEVEDGDIVLDVATGTGKFAAELAEVTSHVIGVDFCPGMVLVGKAAGVEANHVISFVLGDALNLPFASNSFDCAAMGFALRNVADITGCLSEMKRVVKQGGKIVCLEITMPRSRIVRLFYSFYLFKVIPMIGYFLLRDRGKEAYRYLPHSVVNFPTPAQLKEIMEDVGLCQVEYYLLNMGTIALYVAVSQ